MTELIGLTLYPSIRQLPVFLVMPLEMYRVDTTFCLQFSLPWIIFHAEKTIKECNNVHFIKATAAKHTHSRIMLAPQGCCSGFPKLPTPFARYHRCAQSIYWMLESD